MSDFFSPWVRMQQQLLHAHKTNVDMVFQSMGKSGFDANNQAAKAARDVANAQIKAWESWLALWGPKD